MENLSPFSRKLIAAALLFLVVVSVTNVLLVPVIAVTGAQIERLRDARFNRAKLQAIAERPLLPAGDAIAPDSWFKSADKGTAEAAVVALVNGAAARSEVALERAAPVSMGDARNLQLSVDVAATGSEIALAAFIADIEQGRPLIRFTRFKLSGPAAAGEQSRLEARVVAAWNRP